MIHIKNTLLACLTCIAMVGCATPKAVDNAAVAAASQLDRLQSDFSVMVKEHNAYIDEAAKLTNEEIDMLRSIDIDEFFSDNKDQYVTSLSSASAATVESTLPGFARSTLTTWQARERARHEQRARLLKTQEDAAEKIALDFKKLRQLRAKLNALATPGSDKDSLKFIAAYLNEVDKELDKLEEEGNNN